MQDDAPVSTAGDFVEAQPTATSAVPQPLTDAERTKLIEADDIAARAICYRLSDRMGRAEYSEPMKQLLLRAWRLAVQFGNRSVSEEHIIIALALSTDEDAIRALHELLGDYDAAAVTSGALVKIASTGRAAARTPSVEARQASDNTIKWLQKASRFAIAPDGAEKPLTPAHLVQAAGDHEPDDPVRRFVIGAFDEALTVGLPQSQFARTRQSLTSISQTAGRTKTQTDRLREAMRDLTGADGQTGELSRVVDASVSAASASIETDLKKLTTSVDGSRAKLGELDRAVAEIRFNLQDAPEPVSPVSLALAIVAVLGLGTLAGLLIGRL